MGLNFYLGAGEEEKDDGKQVSSWDKKGHIGKRSAGWLFSIDLCAILTYALDHNFDVCQGRRQQLDDVTRIIRNAHLIFSDKPLNRDLLPLVVRNPWLIAEPVERSRNHHNTYTLEIPKEVITEGDIFNIIGEVEDCHDENDRAYSADHMIQEIEEASERSHHRSWDMVAYVNDMKGDELKRYKIRHELTHVVEFRVGRLRISLDTNFS